MMNFTIEGANDLQFHELLGFEWINENIEQTMRRHGYKQILTPNFEHYDMYGLENAVSRESMFKLIDPSGKVLVLRPDATIPICRMSAAQFKNPDELLKFSYVTTIFREDNSNTNYKKDFLQGGIEYFGDPSSNCDGEVISIAIEMLLNLGLEQVQIDIGEVSFLESLLCEMSLSREEQITLKSLIENKNMGDLEWFLNKLDIDQKIADAALTLPMLFGSYQKVMKKAGNLCLNEGMQQALDKLTEVYEVLKIYGYADYVSFDLGFTNQMSYYSGLIFKGYVENYSDSVVAGGRYDKLSKNFGVDRPACGFGINITSLTETLTDKDPIKGYFDVLVSYPKGDLAGGVRASSKLRKLGYLVDTIEEGALIDKSHYKYHVLVKGDQLLPFDESGSTEQKSLTIDELDQLLKGES